MKILLIASLMVMVSAPVMAGKFGGFKSIKHEKKEAKMKQIKVAPKVETITDNQPGLYAIKPLPTTNTKPMLVNQTDFQAVEAAPMRVPASYIQEKAQFMKFKSQETLAP